MSDTSTVPATFVDESGNEAHVALAQLTIEIEPGVEVIVRPFPSRTSCLSMRTAPAAGADQESFPRFVVHPGASNVLRVQVVSSPDTRRA